jgi:hypothetical protein
VNVESEEHGWAEGLGGCDSEFGSAL